MFSAAEALLLGERLSYSRHSAVIAAFGRQFAKTGRLDPEFHRYLIEAQDSRTVADYDAGPGLTEEDAREQVRRAEAFLTIAERVLNAPPHIGPTPE